MNMTVRIYLNYEYTYTETDLFSRETRVPTKIFRALVETRTIVKLLVYLKDYQAILTNFNYVFYKYYSNTKYARVILTKFQA